MRASGIALALAPVTIQAALDLRENRAELARLATALRLSSGLGLLAGAPAGVWKGRRAVRPLADALQPQRRFVSDASHELRTALTLLSTGVQLRHVRRQEAPHDLTDDAAGVVANAWRFTAVLDDLLLAADITADREHEWADLKTPAEEAVAAASGAAGERLESLTFRGDGPLRVARSGNRVARCRDR